MLFPVHTQNLILDKFIDSDIDDNYLSWLNDKDLMKYSRNRTVSHTLKSCRKYLATFRNSNNFFISIKHSNFGKIGTATIYIDEKMQSADIGLLIGDKRCQGKGYGLESWLVIIELIKTIPDVRKLTAGTSSLNVPMIKIIEKSGFLLESEKIFNSNSLYPSSVLSYSLPIY